MKFNLFATSEIKDNLFFRVVMIDPIPAYTDVISR